MKVSMWFNNHDIRLEEVPTPKPGPREMLVKVHSCGICGSDVVEWYRLPRAPLVQGHEIGGEVAETGDAVEEYRPGDRVFVAPKVPCLECEYCRDGHHPVCPNVKERLPGGFAEYVLVPELLVERGTYRLPRNMTYDQSTFIEPLACVVRAQRLAGVSEGQTILVLGCGMSGLLHIRLAKARKCRVAATDVNPIRLEFARRFGADFAFPAGENIPNLFLSAAGRKADVVMICTSALTAVSQAWKCADMGSVIVFFAVPGPDKTVDIPINDFWRKEMTVITSYYCGPPDILEAIELMKDGVIEVDDMITHRLPLKDTAEGFRLVLAGSDSIKVIIHPHA